MPRIVETADCWMIDLIDLLPRIEACKSKSDARRLLKQGAVEINGVKVFDRKINIEDKSIIHVGKLFWRKLRFPIIRMEIMEE